MHQVGYRRTVPYLSHITSMDASLRLCLGTSTGIQRALSPRILLLLVNTLIEPF